MGDLLLLVRTLLALVAVLALAVFVLRWLLPRWRDRLGGAWAGGGEPRVRVVELRPLDRDHKVALVRVARPRGEREVLFAVGAGGASYLDAWNLPAAGDPGEGR